MAFALTFPVVGERVFAAFAKVNRTQGVGIGSAAVGIAVRRTVVVRDINAATAPVAGGSANMPLVGLGAVDKLPPIGPVHLEVAAVRDRGRLAYKRRGHYAGGAAIFGAAVGINVDVVGGGGVKARQRSGGRAVNIHRGTQVLAQVCGGDRRSAVLHHPAGGGAGLRPVQGHPVHASAVHSQVDGSGTGGDIVHLKVVNHQRVAAGTGSAHGHAVARAGVVVKVHRVEVVGTMPVAAAAGGQVDSVQRDEGGVLHHAHLEEEVVVHHRGVERELQQVDAVHLGQSGKLCLTGNALKLEIDAAVAGIVRILINSGESARAAAARLQLLPAGGQLPCGQPLEARGIRKRNLGHSHSRSTQKRHQK